MKRLLVILAGTAMASGCLTLGSGNEGDMVRKISEKHKVLSVEDWYGGRRIEFDFGGYNAWLVCPAAGTKVAEGRPWTWTMQWRTAYVERTGASEMLRRGWHHAAIDTFKHRMDAKGLEVNQAFQRYLVDELGLKPKTALIGMSWGGFFSVRYAATYPDCVDRIYLDAPLLNFHEFIPNFAPTEQAKRIGGDGADWGKGPLDGKSWADDPRMPVNMVAPIAKARIPVLLLYGGQDQTVRPELNSELFISRMRALGGLVQVGMDDAEGRGRAAYGHHPHGIEVNDQAKLAAFFEGGGFDNPLKGISFETPKAWPCPTMDKDDVIKAFWIEGEPYRGQPTRVFAYVALPKGASKDRPVPGMVLAHGGVGTAYHSWVRTWVEKGYAVIAADNCASIPVRMPGKNEWMSSGFGGPRGWGGYDRAGDPVADQWPYHAVASVVRAHSYLRSLPEVDADRIGLTGISWGGFLTMLTASVDHRFKFAAPVYACAYYKDLPLWRKAEARDQRWLDLWEPEPYVRQMTLPVIWFASTGDAAFGFDELQNTFPLLPKAPTVVIRKDMVHSHGPAGENMPELFAFAERHLRNGPELTGVGRLTAEGGILKVNFDTKGRKLRRVDVVWTADANPVKASKWEATSHPAPDGSVFTAPVPMGARRAFVNFVLDGETGEKTYPESVVSSNSLTFP